MSRRLGLTWSLSYTFGWGVFGMNLAMELLRRPRAPQPLLLGSPNLVSFRAEHRAALAAAVREHAETVKPLLRDHPDRCITLPEALVVHGLGDRFRGVAASETFRGRADVGFVFFERTVFEPDVLERARRYRRVFAGSRWNLDLMRAHGMDHAALVHQGVDEAVFCPGPRRSPYGDRFVVFSGGKFELRKGQDLMLCAFRAFHGRHPDSVLVTAWQNHWPPEPGSVVQRGLVATEPVVDPATRSLRLAEWAQAEGLAADAFVDVGWVHNLDMPKVLRAADVAVFPSRAEGGTNLVAMEAMACGVPCVIAANTGQLDLIEPDSGPDGGNSYPLRDQRPIVSLGAVTEGWGESSVDEIVETLERVYTDRAAARHRGRRGAAFMGRWTWTRQVDRLLRGIDELWA